ncbi:tRNA preQ1(34) S-adenosylmethionine ribosyltransferase-isomerase QueA [Bacteriovorax stolpii]|uniref:tRNA preQ1(34) S-adenosylmethionine ribosyltransferase-isomerase QueA n=1 Tax=Bacteriovorax stolpii TaxID=960 RepID=UPI001C8D5C9F|nr:tRNA preQ1(34) S-adenosylmethionine ribosyltransferase-isomerase QueA [Bacteriovorax stolpii]
MSYPESYPDDLLLSSYHYDLPPELIAQRPVDGVNRHQSRLMVYNQKTDTVTHDYFYNLPKYLPAESLIVFNQSKVFPSRLLGNKKSGGKAELFFLSHETDQNGSYPALIKTRSKKNIGDEYTFAAEMKVEVSEIFSDGTFGVKVSLPAGFKNLLDYLEAHALIPIPPYIRKGESDEEDKKNYQTVYSKHTGSVAAPTAGLHFTNDLLEKLKESNIERAFVTLHVGLGTFKPVTVANLKDHVMHSEEYFVDEENLSKIRNAKNVFAVGTTSLRVLESSYGKDISPNEHYKTQIFLHPGVDVKSVSGLITNFHLPESTLLMLVSALIGRTKTLELYELAVKEKYRFFSYGDAMLILR